MATAERLEAALEWAQAQVGKSYELGAFGDEFDCSTYMSGIATMIRDGKASRWFTTHPFHGGGQSPLPGWERDLEAPFMIGITDEGIGHTGGTFLGINFEATPPRVRMGDSARGARNSMYKWVYGFRPSLLDGWTPGQGEILDTITVGASDTLNSLAVKYKTTVDKIVDLNDLLPVGRVLETEAPDAGPVPVTYTAVAGDTWSKIAEKHGISTTALLELNNIKVAAGSSYIVGYKNEDSTPMTPGRISTDKVLFTGKDDPAIQGEGKAFCEEVIRKALTAIGLPVTQAWISGYLTIALRESAYNDDKWRVNSSDSNAIGAIVSDGYPFQCSRGGWQCIPQTFAQYHQAGTSLSIYDPVANCAASINYVRTVYKVADDGSNLSSRVQQADPSRPPRGY